MLLLEEVVRMIFFALKKVQIFALVSTAGFYMQAKRHYAQCALSIFHAKNCDFFVASLFHEHWLLLLREMRARIFLMIEITFLAYLYSAHNFLCKI